MSLSPDEMRVRFEQLSPAQQVEFLRKLQVGMELMATVSSTIQNAIVTLYPVFEEMGKIWKELEVMLEPLEVQIIEERREEITVLRQGATGAEAG